MMAHLPIAPILLPFLVGTLLLALGRLSLPAQRVLALVSVLAQIGAATALLVAVSGGDILVYRLGDWPAPWGIVLVADRLSAWMVLITTLLALWALIYASHGIDGQGRHFHVLFQMQLFGLAGAFLTGDLFNLFVFFEILLIASYGLALHGGGKARTRAGLHYVVMNLAGSTVFLFAAGLIYASMGSLNMADLAAKAGTLAPDMLGLARAGGLLLLAVFALKAALLPLHLWLPAAYSGTSAPVAALFAIMTKVGIYAILRSHTLLFGDSAGALAHLFDPWLMPLALATIVIGTLGVLAADSLGRLSGYLVLVSVGTLLTAVAVGTNGIAAALYYLPHSTFTAALLFLLSDAIRRRRLQHGDGFTPDADMPRHALWGGLFFAAAVAVTGLPPLSGFIGKFLILRAVPDQPWVWAVILLAALLAVIALARAGSQVFFNSQAATVAQVPKPGACAAELALPGVSSARELLAVGGLLGLILALTVFAGPALDYANATAQQLTDPARYISAVLGGRP
ncbi:MAG: monovalent cation/H+ antiporter subunit D [Rhodoferax sp.]|jgi:multicomponent K+:H+ antiporter subunit D|uniref:monovalent cation/H+ antiporter subunit D n=2 Tax=Rhodoferax sp. TaxID=50421 RepID=UPI0027319DF4|nr:monovalent cation/H+ antiporter subunit D [Rhodoferax sp.]MDP2442427.1 monovalent cation/H+ antiporter subunit D [Rhodoferax sp.]MDZ4209219.1 monovalent cation/H+ antiporter subunit D [Rhodoferax sp.]